MTVAERAAAEGFNVVVLDKRDHIGGNAYSYEDSATGIEIHKYGPHVFHTNSEQIFAYLSRFTEWKPYEQRTWSLSKGRIYPLPINLATISLFNGRVMSPSEARAWVAETASEITEPRNLEEKAISLIGRPLYETFVKGYTASNGRRTRFSCPPTSSRACRCASTTTTAISTTRTNACRATATPRSLTRCPPRAGSRCIWASIGSILPPIGARPPPVVYTGPIDRYFDYRFGILGWRTIDLELETSRPRTFRVVR